MSRDLEFLSEDQTGNIKIVIPITCVFIEICGFYAFMGTYHRSVKQRNVRTYYFFSAYIKDTGINSQDDPYNLRFSHFGC